MSRVALASGITDAASRDPVLANLVELAGPLTHRPRDPDGHFGMLVRAIVFQQLAGSAARAIQSASSQLKLEPSLRIPRSGWTNVSSPCG